MIKFIICNPRIINHFTYGDVLIGDIYLDNIDEDSLIQEQVLGNFFHGVVTSAVTCMILSIETRYAFDEIDLSIRFRYVGHKFEYAISSSIGNDCTSFSGCDNLFELIRSLMKEMENSGFCLLNYLPKGSIALQLIDSRCEVN